MSKVEVHLTFLEGNFLDLFWFVAMSTLSWWFGNLFDCLLKRAWLHFGSDIHNVHLSWCLCHEVVLLTCIFGISIRHFIHFSLYLSSSLLLFSKMFSVPSALTQKVCNIFNAISVSFLPSSFYFQFSLSITIKVLQWCFLSEPAP